MQILSTKDWKERAAQHAALVSPYTDAFLKRRALGHSHPVHDFLFTYYSCSPLKLKQWVPSFEQTLITTPSLAEEYPWLNSCWFETNEHTLFLKKERIHANMHGLIKFVADLCHNVLERTPRFGCFGLHEWAMVYKLSPEVIRHKNQPLRLSANELALFVESQTICCSHYDAYRFFTPEAQPLNILNPLLDTRLQMEQSGCVHVNMDLYKWSTKLWPWVGSDFIAKSFLLALEARELDMRASPYDLNDKGYLPIYIETEEGRKLYQKEQQRLTEKATPLRRELHELCVRLLAYADGRA